MKTTMILGLTLPLAVGCIESAEESDGRDDTFLTGDKTDAGAVVEGSRQATGVLRVANEASLEALDENAPEGVGLSNRAVDNVAWFRLGDDGLPGTADDGKFDTLAELDAIPYIGPIAFQKLLRYAEDNGFVPHGTIVNGTLDVPASLVAYREGLDGPWQAAVMKSPTSFEIEVDAAYILAVACEDLPSGSFVTVRLAQHAEDGDVAAFCGATIENTRAVTGHMVQAGRVVIGSAGRSSSAPEWDFTLNVQDGTYDVVAASPDGVAVRRGVTVAGDTALAPIDVATQGQPLVALPLTAEGAVTGETLTARVTLRPRTNSATATLFSGALADAKIAPSTVLVATDRQRASVTATAGTLTRSVSRSVQASGNTTFALPARLENPQWTITDGELQARIGSLPANDFLFLEAYGSSADFTKFWYHDLEISPRFLEAVGAPRVSVTRLTLDTDIPGYKDEWKLDFAQSYTRSVFAQKFNTDEVASSSSTEVVPASSGRVAPPQRLPVVAARRLER